MNLRVVTHSGEDITVQVESFDAKGYAEDINNNEISVIEIGGVVFSRIDIKLIQPVEIEEQEADESHDGSVLSSTVPSGVQY